MKKYLFEIPFETCIGQNGLEYIKTFCEFRNLYVSGPGCYMCDCRIHNKEILKKFNTEDAIICSNQDYELYSATTKS